MERYLKQQIEEGYFQHFDQFLIEKWGDSGEKEIGRKRKSAYKKLKRQVKGKTVAASRTIQKWFGIKGKSVPDREHFFRLALALELTTGEAEEYLQKGLLMPGVQVNDYQEIIYYYGIEKHLLWEECRAMIEIFESQMNQDVVLEQRTNTNELWVAYDGWKILDREHFLKKMCQNAGMFKGYSKTSLKYFIKYKNEILRFVRKDAMEALEEALQRTDFFQWAKEHQVTEKDYKDEILRYIKNVSRRKNHQLTSEQKEEIKFYHKTAYAGQDRNTDLISELYAAALEQDVGTKSHKIKYHDRGAYQLPDEVRFCKESYLSQLLNVSVQMEKQIRLCQALAAIRQEPEEIECPEWIQDLLGKNFSSEEMLQDQPTSEQPSPEQRKKNSLNCGEARRQLKDRIYKQKKCCHIIQREDLLPLIHCVAQRQYTDMMEKQGAEYDCEKAKQIFVEMVDATLTACHMERLHEWYEMDYLLLACYQPENMYSYGDMIEKSRGI